MAVNLSPVGGVAAQFFTNSGAVLTGGKIFTYLAGTTTPQAAYTTSQGNVAWTNPIVLDAAGRVPSGGEIWLTDGLIYKFVLKDANDVLIATYDNITGINSNSVAFVNQQEIITATAGQTVFNLGISYQLATNSLSVFVDGVNQYGPGAQYSYVETDSNTVTFNAGLHVGAEVKFTTTQQQSAGAVDAQQVTYDPPFTGSVATNVEAKLAQTVSVKDFGAVGDGVTDDTAAIQAALDTQKSVFIPAGEYYITSTLAPYKQQIVYGEGNVERSYLSEPAVSKLLVATDVTAISNQINIAIGMEIKNLAIVAQDQTNSSGQYGIKVGILNDTSGASQGIKTKLQDVYVSGFDTCFGIFGNSWETTLDRCFADFGRTYGFHVEGAVTVASFTDCSVLNNGAAYGTAPVNSASSGILIENNSQVFFHSLRVENSVTTGLTLLGKALVNMQSTYFEGNRTQDVVVDATFDGVFVWNGGQALHDNAGVTTFAVVKNQSTQKCVIDISNVYFSVGEVNNNTITCGFYYAEDTTPYVKINNLQIGPNVAKMSTGNAKVVYLSQGSRYAPSEFSVSDLPRVTFYQSANTHIASLVQTQPASLLISDGTNTFDMLTDKSVAYVNGVISVYDAGTSAWVQIAP